MPQIMVEVDVDEVIGDISTQDLMDELKTAITGRGRDYHFRTTLIQSQERTLPS